MSREFMIGISLVLFLLIEVYAFQAFKVIFQQQKLFLWLYGLFSLATILYIIYLAIQIKSSRETFLIQRLVFLSVLVFVTKGFICFGLLIEDIFRVFAYFTQKLIYSDQTVLWPGRRKFVALTSVALAGIPFLGILHGVFFGRYRYRVIEKSLSFEDLPAAFDGYRILQISDIHSGSFDNREKVAYGIDLINQQNADLVLFTGDLVNNAADEMEPWIPLFAQIKAKDGKFSVLGNHDYGDYVPWKSPEAKRNNLARLKQIHGEIGFELLNNRHVSINRGEEKIQLLGVENWGDPPFPQHGDLEATLKGVAADDFCVLMSHDPTHFDRQVKQHPKKISLCLSGHTHGMQFGIEIPGLIKWSPVKLKYAKWAGLYESMGRYLYVNRGFGYIAFPGRVGMWPEITVITLHKA